MRGVVRQVMVRLYFCILFAACLAGCALAPGLHLDEDQFEDSDQAYEGLLPIPLRLITPKVVKTQYESRKTSEAEIKRDDNGTAIDGLESAYGQYAYRYRVGPQDILNVIVWDHPELTTPSGGQRSAEVDGHLVNADGTIFYPYAGTVFVGGKTVDEIREILTDKLSKYIRNPQVSVSVVSFGSKKIYVLGDIARPAAIPITNIPLYLAEVISNAGINQSSADPERIFVLRLEDSKPIAYHLDASEPGSLILATAFQMQPQDVVFVSSADIARWGQTLRQILPSLNTIWLIDANN